jgi:DNA polymerase-3 subunit epsilon
VRQIVLDTETTGIGPEQGHKLIEIGCVELVDRRLTGKHYHVYLNPERTVDPGAFRVHGISTEFLQDKPLFKDVVSAFVDFIDGAELIIHNAPFDVGFLNHELRQIQWKKSIADYCSVLDTLALAKSKHPGQRNNLDALCKRYEVDNSNRALHGALLDAQLLAYVYLAMTGGQSSFFSETQSPLEPRKDEALASELAVSDAVVHLATAEELSAHQDFLAFLTKQSGLSLWED